MQAKESAGICFTQEQFAELMNSMKRMQSEPTRTGTFTTCTARFDGTRDRSAVESFIAAASIFKCAENIEDASALEGLPLLLTKDAAAWWLGIKGEVRDWESATTLLRHAFAPKKPAYKVYTEIFLCKQDALTSTDVFIAKQRMLLAELPPPRHPEKVQIDLIFGQLNIRIRDRVPREAINTFAELLQKARAAEESLYESTKTVPLRAMENRTDGRLRCTNCRRFGHRSEECRSRYDTGAHVKYTPPVKKLETPSDAKFACYGCGKPGVVRSKCPQCSQGRIDTPHPRADFCSIHEIGLPRARPILHIGIGNFLGTAHVDTGAKLSVASAELHRRLIAQNFKTQRTIMDIVLADGVPKRQEVETIAATLTLRGRQIPTSFIVLPGGHENRTLLGVDFIEDAGIDINIPQRAWAFTDSPEVRYMLHMENDAIPPNRGIRQRQKTGEIGEVRAHKLPKVCLPAPPVQDNECEIYVPPFMSPLPQTPPKVRLPAPPAQDNECEIYVPPFMSPFSQTPPRTNIWAKMIALNELFPEDAMEEDALREVMIRSYRLFDDSPRKSRNEVELCALDAEILSLRPDEATHLIPTQRDQLDRLLCDNAAVFSATLSSTTKIEHRIETGQHPPISVAPYRLSPARQAELRAEINSMLTQGIIEEADSPWAAPVVMVPKKDGNKRICIDFRLLNAITVPDVYPLPRMDDLLHSAKQSNFMSTVDLRSGYWQIKILEKDRDKTAFITPFGLYRFLKMPFGLRNAPGTFQRMIDRLKIELDEVNILAYLDDIIILSPTFDKHLADLQQVFTKLREFNLTANRVKCHFCCPSIKYLGHVITPGGISTNPEKIEAISKMKEPNNVKQLQTFLQTCSWYRRFVPEFAKTAKPLSDLIKKDATWEWKSPQQNAFDTLKALLTSAPILRQADGSKEFIIKSDASSYAIGAVLVQGEGLEEHPVEYASRLLLPAERNYSTTEREALAVVWAVAKFRGYIEGTAITVVTDHQALKWLMTLKSPTGRLARWALQLQPYNLKIQYTPGRSNLVADTLSRPPLLEDPPSICALCTITLDVPVRNAADIRREQLKDTALKKIIECFEANNPNEDLSYWTAKGYLMQNGVLYRYAPDIEEEDAQLVVPEHEQHQILMAYHDAPTAGHYGVERTIRRIARRYFWKNMRTYIQKYVKNCLECQRYKPSNLKPAGLLQTSVMNQRFETVAFDLFGPLPTSEDGKNWIFIIEDVATRWIELFPLKDATAETCARVLIDEVCLRYGTPRRLISDNGTQFVSAVMQQMTYCLDIKHTFTPAYHPEANPVERKNRDLKPQLAILVGTEHRKWAESLPSIRFAMNTAFCQSTGYSAAYLTFGRELRSADDVGRDLRSIILSENFIPEITPHLLQLADTLRLVRTHNDEKQDKQKNYVDNKRREDPHYQPGDHVFVHSHALSKAARGFSAKLGPRRDGPYLILKQHGPTSYEVASMEAPDVSLGTYHTSALTPYHGHLTPPPAPVIPLRKRGRPKKNK